MVDQRMVADKGVQLPADQEVTPWKNGLVTFASFMLFGSTPLLSFIVLISFTNNGATKFVGALPCLGTCPCPSWGGKGKIAGQNYMFSTAVTLFSGAIVAVAAYLVGWSLKNVVGLEG